LPRVEGEEPVGGDDPTAEEEIVGKSWGELETLEHKKAFMRVVVAPKMGAMFQAFDGEKFSRFGCGTCHGSGAATRDFKMPGTIPALDFGALPDDPVVGFMQNTVVPEMAAVLGQEVFDPQTQEGFGCLGCHMRK